MDNHLTELEKKVIAELQGDIPIESRPYLIMAQRIDISEEEFIKTAQDLSQRGIIRRYGATLRHQKSGFTANAMIAWKVDEAMVEDIGSRFASENAVSHCYRRNPTQDWPYNLYTMVHATDKQTCHQIAAQMAQSVSLANYAILFSQRELKKTSMMYFDQDE